MNKNKKEVNENNNDNNINDYHNNFIKLIIEEFYQIIR